MKHLFTLGLALGSAAALAQTPITISQAQYPATAGTVERYQPIATTGLATPRTGANQSWDYRTVSPQGPVETGTYASPGATPPFAGSVRSYTFDDGALGVAYTAYEGFDADGFGRLGTVNTTQNFPIDVVTGGAGDEITVLAATTSQRILTVPLPMSSTTRTVRFSRFAINSLFTIQAAGLNQTPFRQVSRVTAVDSVAGWGTLRIPVAGSAAGSAPIPVLLDRRRYVVQDSFYLGGQPAPAALLAGLGLAQDQLTTDFRYRFFRQGAAQPVMTLLYDDSRFATPSDAAYSDEATIPLGTQTAREVATGGLLTWPNPAVAGQRVQFALAAGSPGQALRISLRDATGRVVAQLAGPNGQPTTLPLLPAGLYLAEAEAADGSRASRRLVVE